MKHLTPQIIADITGGEYIGRDEDLNIRVQGAARDNREVMPGNLFICIPGTRVDGHSFAQSAFEAGAACCLAERTLTDVTGPYVRVKSTLEAVKTLGGYYRSLSDIPIIGITGSVGKTTTKELVAAVLGARFSVLKTPENLNNELGVPLTLLSLTDQHEAAVIEMGISDFGEMSVLAEMVRPDILVMTTIGHAHLDALGDLDGVLKAKTEVFLYMRASGIGILNGDDEFLRKYDPGLRKITFGLGHGNDFRSENIRADGIASVSCDIVSDKGRFWVTIPAFGEHLAMMALPAAAAGRLLGLSDEEIIRGLNAYIPVGGRSNVKETGHITLIDDCYNASPASVKAALKSLAGLTGRRVAILGDMLELGDHADDLHREIGEAAYRHSLDSLICCGDKARLVYDGFVTSGGTSARYFKTKAELIAELPELIEKDDIVLVKASHSMGFGEIVEYLAAMMI
ncbi:MAG: UDP-N-acetylmuramoyl-tripeptide--D-alanyl-D-alanine ligase [Oscillospiraceae bacterium]|nr:UDP-N-acetylmuramoyl-tripeptide--D-alanyl-D-alanine ligase [Oscillospiraceae bacterium]